MTKLEKAIELVGWFYQNKKDLGGEPYALHPLRVMLSIPGNEPEAQVVAVLHDVLEDGMSKLELAALNLSKREVDALNLLTRQRGQGYEDYIQKIAINRIATMVKIADLKDNLDKNRTAQLLLQGDSPAIVLKRVAKYRRALAVLE